MEFLTIVLWFKIVLFWTICSRWWKGNTNNNNNKAKGNEINSQHSNELNWIVKQINFVQISGTTLSLKIIKSILPNKTLTAAACGSCCWNCLFGQQQSVSKSGPVVLFPLLHFSWFFCPAAFWSWLFVGHVLWPISAPSSPWTLNVCWVFWRKRVPIRLQSSELHHSPPLN